MSGERCCEHLDEDHDQHGCTVDVSVVSRVYERCHGLGQRAPVSGDADLAAAVVRAIGAHPDNPAWLELVAASGAMAAAWARWHNALDAYGKPQRLPLTPEEPT